jgi:hypothetical protein
METFLNNMHEDFCMWFKSHGKIQDLLAFLNLFQPDSIEKYGFLFQIIFSESKSIKKAFTAI